MVESRTSDMLHEWEKAKPVEGCIRPADALRQLQAFEIKFSKLKEERDNVSKAKEALELQVGFAFFAVEEYFIISHVIPLPVCYFEGTGRN